jgi:hypothetical protein
MIMHTRIVAAVQAHQPRRRLMSSFGKSLAAFAGLLVLAGLFAALMPSASRGQGNVAPPFGARKFYLTKTAYDGDHALSACAEGYHMASLWEIFDTSNLRYDTQLGHSRDDSGFGPPSNAVGWIRTGGASFSGPAAGAANCNAWTSASDTDFGTAVLLTQFWGVNRVEETITTPVTPWVGVAAKCSFSSRVWCVQD